MWMFHCVQHRPDFHCFTWHCLAPLAIYICTFPLWGFMVEQRGAFHYGLPNLVLTKTRGDMEVDEQTEGAPFWFVLPHLFSCTVPCSRHVRGGILGKGVLLLNNRGLFKYVSLASVLSGGYASCGLQNAWCWQVRPARTPSMEPQHFGNGRKVSLMLHSGSLVCALSFGA